MSHEILPSRLVAAFGRPLLDADNLVLNAIRANARFLREKAASAPDPIAAQILEIAAQKMLTDVENEIAARN